jgi:hypothetical protein
MMVTLMPSGATSAASLGEPAYGELGQLVGAEGRGDPWRPPMEENWMM